MYEQALTKYSKGFGQLLKDSANTTVHRPAIIILWPILFFYFMSSHCADEWHAFEMLPFINLPDSGNKIKCCALYRKEEKVVACVYAELNLLVKWQLAEG